MSELPILAILCTAYNHAPYIRQCLEGFVMQKTTFPFIAIVHDDASTDNTAEIIREYEKKYPDIIKPIYETENQYSKPDGSLRRIMAKAVPGSVKYIALCEGDDYWTDSLKLQKQVEYLERNPSCGLVYTKVKYFSQQKNKFTKFFGEEVRSLQEFINKGNTIPTLTVLYKKSIAEKYSKEIKPENHHWSMGDLPMWLYFTLNSKIGFIYDCTGVYRVLRHSASHFSTKEKLLNFQLNSLEIMKFFADRYDVHSEQLETNLLWYKYEYCVRTNNHENTEEILRSIRNSEYRFRKLKLVIIEIFSRCPKLYLLLLNTYRKIRKYE